MSKIKVEPKANLPYLSIAKRAAGIPQFKSSNQKINPFKSQLKMPTVLKKIVLPKLENREKDSKKRKFREFQFAN
jgi:hypothetical protein